MDIIQLFNEMISDENIEVSSFAIRAQELKQYLDDNQLSQDEYNELVDDFLELKTINKNLLSLDVQKKLVDFANILKEIKFFASLM
jgi:hypothetical protein